MENRFGFKELVISTLLLALIVLVIVAMVMFDRQWERIARINTQLNDQARVQSRVESWLERIATNTQVAAALPEEMAKANVLLMELAKSNVDGAELAKQLAALQQRLAEIEARRAANGSTFNGDPFAHTATPTGDIFRRQKEAMEKNEDYARGDWFVDNLGAPPPKLNELTAHDVYSRVIYSRVMESLAEYDIGKVKVVPLLAESWQTAEDGLSTTFKLRKNVTFSNGEPLTADDVVHTYRLTMNENVTEGHTREYYRYIIDCEKIDDHTVTFRYGEVHYENFLRAAGIKIHSKRFLSNYTDSQIKEHLALLLGTGPYRLADATKYTPGEPIVIVRNERYWGVPGPWDRMVFNVIEKESTEQIAFQNGELDVYAPLPEQHYQMLNDPALVARTQHYVYEHVRTGYTYIGWNQKRKDRPTWFADKRVRQAMTMLIDRERMVDEIWLGFASVASGPFHHLGPQHNPAIKPWPYDRDRAVALLKEAGFTLGANDRVIAPDGTPFDVELTYSAGSEFVHRIALSLKDNFARGGVNLKLDPVKWPVMLEKLNNKDFDAITLGWGAGGIEGDIEQMFHTRTIKEGDNRNAYSNPQLDALIDQAHRTLDEDERMKIWRQCHAILHEDQPYTFMFRGKVRLWADQRLKNIQRIPVFGVNYVSTWSVPLEWYVPLDKQKRGRE